MPCDAETLALMRQVLDDVCRDVPVGQNNVRTHVATALLDCANRGERSLDALKHTASAALCDVYPDIDGVSAISDDLAGSTSRR